MSLTNRAAQAFLNSFFGRTSNFGAFASAPDLHLAASTTTPTEAGGNFTEPVGNAYARLDITSSDFNDATLADPSALDNSSALTFVQASGGSWGTITHVGVYDALSGGNLLLSLALSVSRTIDDGDTLSFSAGEFDVTLD